MPSSVIPRRIALVGLMGAGKSRVGRALAERLGWPFEDADRLVEARTGRSVSELFQERGEEAFRDLETETLQELALRPPPLVAALGGGVVERAANRACLIAEFWVVWLDVTPEEAARRVGRRPGRPLLAAGAPLPVLRELAQRRSPWYGEVAALTLPTRAVSRAPGLADRILKALGPG